MRKRRRRPGHHDQHGCPEHHTESTVQFWYRASVGSCSTRRRLSKYRSRPTPSTNPSVVLSCVPCDVGEALHSGAASQDCCTIGVPGVAEPSLKPTHSPVAFDWIVKVPLAMGWIFHCWLAPLWL